MLIAYDFGDSVHVLDVDEFGVALPDSADVLPLDGDRDETLEGAGYRIVGGWTAHGEAEGAPVERRPAPTFPGGGF
jgi:hypothetical protein